MRLSLRSKIAALFLGLILGLGMVVVGAFYLLTGAEIQRAARRDVDSASRLMTRMLAERSAHLMAQTKLIADLPTFQAAIASGNSATVEDRARVYLARVNADAITVTDRNGVRLTGSGSDEEAAQDLSKDPAIASALEGRDWSGVRVIGSRLMLMTTVPIRIGRYVQGAMTAYSEIGSDTARQLKESLSTDVVFLVGSRVVGSSSSGASRIRAQGPDVSQVRLNGKIFVVLRAPVPGAGTGASFIVVRDRSELAAGYEQFSVAFLLVLVLSSLSAVAAASAFAKRITQPLGGVVEAAELLRAGAWPERFEATRQDEIGILQTTFNEMTEALQESERRLLSLIDTDPLTELDNYRRFRESLDFEIARCAASDTPLALILLDLDLFEAFNERRGHVAGDEFLKSAAAALREVAPGIALLARQSGDGFSLTLPVSGLEDAVALAEQVRGQIEELGEVTASCGCAEVGPGTKSSSTLILAAEIALERAKQLGRNQVARYDHVPGADETTDPRELSEYLQDASLSTIQALAAAVDAKDHYTRGHSQRVAEYASSLCRYIGGTDTEVDLTYRTGTLHDVGKIGVPDGILNKPGRLTDEERAVIESHPIVGELIVKKVPQLADTLPGVRWHHERWDGAGYPDGLKGQDIPRLARLLAIADTFDAMTSDRPYRKGMPIDAALQEIVRCAGIQFDPYLATSFAKMMWEQHGLGEAA